MSCKAGTVVFSLGWANLQSILSPFMDLFNRCVVNLLFLTNFDIPPIYHSNCSCTPTYCSFRGAPFWNFLYFVIW